MTLLTRANCSQTCYSISVTPNGENQMGTSWYRKRNRPQNENYISNEQKSVKSKAFKESVRVVGSKLFA